MVRNRLRLCGLVGGPSLALVCYVALGWAPVETALAHEGRAVAALALWMATWWLSEAIDISATALLPIVVLPLTGAATAREATASYAHELIFLFMGGFMIALAMERWNLHKRIALLVLRVVGTRPAHMVAGFMGVSAFLSMWVSNTATAVMMLPIALSVVALVREQAGVPQDEPLPPLGGGRNFAICLLLGIAYASSVGGIGTMIGTPPNLFLVSFMRDQLHIEISFVRWMAVGVPLVVVFVPLIWWLLTRVLYPIALAELEGGRALVGERYRALGPLGAGERWTAIVFVACAVSWMARPFLTQITIFGFQPLAGLNDTVIAMGAALVLFVLPIERKAWVFVLDWKQASRLPWGVLVLFGGGLSLADAMQRSGVSAYLGEQVVALAALPEWFIVVAVITGVIFLTELTSNTATAAALIPILAAVAPGLAIAPVALIVPAAIACSCAFMLPVATPPNAIVFGSRCLRVADMARAGWVLNLVGVVLITGLLYAVVVPLLVFE